MVGGIVLDRAVVEQLPSRRDENEVDAFFAAPFEERRRAVKCAGKLAALAEEFDRAFLGSVVEVAGQ